MVVERTIKLLRMRKCTTGAPVYTTAVLEIEANGSICEYERTNSKIKS